MNTLLPCANMILKPTCFRHNLEVGLALEGVKVHQVNIPTALRNKTVIRPLKF